VNAHVVRVTINADLTVPDTGQDVEGYSVFVVGSSDSGRDSLIFDNPYGPKREILDGISDFTDWDNRAGKLRFMHGNLDGRYDYSTETYGMAAGDPNGEHITADDSKGLRLRSGTDTLAQISGTALTLGKNGAIRFDPTQSPEARVEGVLQMDQGQNMVQMDPSVPAEKFMEGGDLIAVLTAETNPSYSPVQTDAVSDTSPDGTGVNSYTLSGKGIWISFSTTVTNGNSQDSETIGAELRDANTGDVIASPTTTASASETVTVGALKETENITDVEVECINSSAFLEEVTINVYKPLTVISRDGVRVYKTPNSFQELI